VTQFATVPTQFLNRYMHLGQVGLTRTVYAKANLARTKIPKFHEQNHQQLAEQHRRNTIVEVESMEVETFDKVTAGFWLKTRQLRIHQLTTRTHTHARTHTHTHTNAQYPSTAAMLNSENS